jgi:hypothetical protein
MDNDGLLPDDDTAALDQLLAENRDKREALATLGFPVPTIFELKMELDLLREFFFTAMHGPLKIANPDNSDPTRELSNATRQHADLLFQLEFNARLSVKMDESLIKARRALITRK